MQKHTMLLLGVSFTACSLTALSASADEPAAAPAAPAAAPAKAPAPAPMRVDAEEKDGVRFRGGIAASGGGEFAGPLTFGMGGLDGRLGVQINHLIGVYAQLHSSLGSGTYMGQPGYFTGTFAASAVVDFTLWDRMFVGAGGGYGVLNNPTGPMIHLRLGGYPVSVRGDNGIRRKGLMMGADLRVVFLDTFSEPVTMVMGSIGYEAF